MDHKTTFIYKRKLNTRTIKKGGSRFEIAGNNGDKMRDTFFS